MFIFRLKYILTLVLGKAGDIGKKGEPTEKRAVLYACNLSSLPKHAVFNAVSKITCNLVLTNLLQLL